MIWATVSSWSCFCWLYRASPSLAAKNIINLISVLTMWWCPCVESSLVLLEEGVCYDQCVLLAKLYISLCPASFRTPRPNLPLTPGVSWLPTFAFCCFLLFLCSDRWGRLSYFSWLFFGTLHSNGNMFPFLLCFSLLFFSQLFVRPPQTTILPFCISFPWGWSWFLSPVQCHEPRSIVHQALCLSVVGWGCLLENKQFSAKLC